MFTLVEHEEDAEAAEASRKRDCEVETSNLSDVGSSDLLGLMSETLKQSKPLARVAAVLQAGSNP